MLVLKDYDGDKITFKQFGNDGYVLIEQYGQMFSCSPEQAQQIINFLTKQIKDE